MARLLLKIRNEHLYKPTHATFLDYCEKRWRWRRLYAYYQIQGVEVMAILGLCTRVHKPETEKQVRPLVQVRARSAARSMERRSCSVHEREADSPCRRRDRAHVPQ